MCCKVLCLESSYPINTRTQRIIDSLGDFKIHVCTWDRSSKKKEEMDGYSIFHTPSVGYGNRMLKLIYLVSYAFFIKGVIKREKPEIIIASHWDMLVISALLKRNEKLIYDNVDLPEFRLSIIEKLIIFFEYISLKRVDATLLASRFYLQLYDNEKSIVFENLPVKVNDCSFVQRKVGTGVVKIGFVGSVRHFELLKNLMLAVNNVNNVEFHIYGDGIANSKLKEYSEQNSIQYLHFHGSFEYENISKIYGEIDVLWAAYPYKSRNVKYAISNKFFESICFTIPCLFSVNTLLGEYVETNGIGVTVDPYSVEGIEQGILRLIRDYNQICLSLNNLRNAEDISWNKNEKTIIKLVCGLIKND